MIDFEDTYLDCIKKACLGKGFNKQILANKTGYSLYSIKKFLKGYYSNEILEALAKILDLGIKALRSHAQDSKRSDLIAPSILHQYQTNFLYEDTLSLNVNHYLLLDPNTNGALLFDTGTDAKATIQDLLDKGRILNSIFITHQHKDHIYALEDYLEAFPTVSIYASLPLKLQAKQTQILSNRQNFLFGSLRVEAYHTPGHSKDGFSYMILGLEKPLMFVGDSIFSHSQGGTRTIEDYQIALNINKTVILSQYPETILAPGHGPLTTVEHENLHNPFYAK